MANFSAGKSHRNSMMLFGLSYWNQTTLNGLSCVKSGR